MSNRGDKAFINDIHEAIQRILAYRDGMTYQDFFEDIKTQDAVV